MTAGRNPHRHRRLGPRVLAALVIVAALVAASAGPAAAAPEPVSSCQAELVDGSILVTWEAAPAADTYVVYRSVNGSPDYWRGTSTTTSFTDTNRSGTLDYSVSTKLDGVRSDRTPCTSIVPPSNDPTPVESCSVSLEGAAIEVTWPAAAVAESYVIYRSVNGSPDYWRGTSTTTSFTDTNRSGTLDYSVRSKADGVRSDPTICGAPPPPPSPEPPTDCVATVLGDQIEITFTPAPGADLTIVYRSVDDGPAYWRGTSTAAVFTDSSRTGALAYSVRTKIGNERSDFAPCVTAIPPPPIASADALVVGDMASCGPDAAHLVALLLDRVSGPIWAAGDLVYDNGTPEEFTDCFDPTFGHQRPRFRPVPGNHDYGTPGAAGYFAYFGAAAGDPGAGYHRESVDGWDVLFLNSNCFDIDGCELGSPQYQWVQSQLQGVEADDCLAAVWHHPRWSSWGPYASQPFLDDLLVLLDDHGLDLLLTGHAHHYERLAPLNAAGDPDDAGFVQITVGTGGTALRQPAAADVLATSATLITDRHGVLALDLEPTGYRFDFLDVTGGIGDTGTGSCGNG